MSPTHAFGTFFLPGPTDVRPEVLAAMTRPMIPHRGREFEELYQLAEGLMEWDERVTTWRIRHYKVVARIIGDQVVGTQGTPVEVLGKMIHHNFFPALWRARNQLTSLAKEQEAAEADAEVPGHGR